MFTRIEYLNASRENGPDAHRRYYAQFVNDSTKALLLTRISLPRILDSTNPHFNDIPLVQWDNCPLVYNAAIMKAAGDYLTLSGKVCILKEAALQLKESNAKP